MRSLKRPANILFRALLSTLVLCSAFSLALSQTVNTRINGTVKDNLGATVPSAKVTLIDNTTKEQRSATTNDEGTFVFADVRPGTYTVIVEGTGFKKLQVSNVLVHVDTPVVLNTLTLETGGVTETVSVTASEAQSLIRSEDAKLSTTIDVKQVQDLPLNGRNPINLAGGMAGVNTNTNTRQSVINGMRGSFSNITWDGIEINDNLVRTDALFGVNTPSVASVAEFSVTTQNAGPDDGLGIAQIKLTTPRGGANYHGEAYDFYRNDKFDANTFINNTTGLPKPKLLQHQYGFNVGGPFALPRFGEGGPRLIEKNKLFFYFFYEYIDTKQDFTPNRTVLTQAARTGNFTYLRTDNGQLNTVNLLTLTGRQLDPRIQELLNLTPTPNNTARGDNRNSGGFRFNTPNGSTGRNIGFRIDYEISQKHRVEGIYSHFLSKLPNDVQLNDIGEQFPGLPGGGQESDRPRYSLAWISSLTPSISNEFRFGFSSSTPLFFNRETFDKGYRLGFPNVGGNTVTNPIQNFLQQGRAPRNHDLINHTTWVKGSHVFRFGTTARFVKILNFNDGGIIPQYNIAFNTTTNPTPLINNSTNFPGGLSSTQFTTANNLLALVTGAVNTGVQTFNVEDRTSGFHRGVGSIRHLDYNTLSFYGGDTWRVKENLSLNFGLRWEYIAPLTERDGLGLMPVNTSLDVLRDPRAVLDFAGKGTGREFLAKDLNNFAPNFSFAWDPFKTGKTSIRGGFSIAYAIDNNATVLNNSSVGGNAGLQSTVTRDMVGTVSGTGTATIATPAFRVPRTIEDNLALSQAPTLFTTEFNLKTPYAEQWNFGIEREIFKDTALSVGYVGNRGVQLTRGLDTNQVIIFQNGFLADFLRGQGNLTAVRAERDRINNDPTLTQAQRNALLAQRPISAAFNTLVPGSVALSIFPRLGLGGNLANATIINLFDQSQVGELVSNYLSSRCTYFIQNPIQGCLANFRIGPNTAQIGAGFFLPTNPNAFVTDYIGSSGWSNYHGLQAEIRKRFTNGWYYQINYTWSKAFTNAEQAQAEFSPYLDNAVGDTLEKKRLNQDVHHVFKANAVYELPFGPGQRWLDKSGFAGKLFGGWQISGIAQFRTGRPISFLTGDGTNNSSRGTLNRSARSGNNTPNTTLTLSELQARVGLFHDPRTGLPLVVDPELIGPDGRANPAFFQNPAAGTVGHLSLTPVDGPGYWNVDTALIKRIRFKERLGVELRLEAFNVFNHTNFSVPNQLDINDPSFGKINAVFDPRILQLAWKFTF